MAEDQKSMAESAHASPPATSAKFVRVVTVMVMVAALIVGTYALARLDPWGESKASVPQSFQLDLQRQVQVPPELLGYRQQAQFGTTLREPHAIAVTAEGTILVAGDQAIVRLNAAGQVLGTIQLDQAPACLAAGPAAEQRIYVACGRHIVVLGADGETISQWPDLEPQSVLTSIVVSGEHLYVADAGQRVVHIFDRDGRALRRIGAVDPERHASEFVIPSPYFDVVAGADDTLWVVNPGKRHLECYSLTGDLQSIWGQGGASIADFFGCCNPAHIALLPDGRFVTSEKGIPRIKVYSEAGDFECVVAGPSELGVSASALTDARGNQAERVFDVAVAPDGAIVVLDTRERTVRVFVAKEREARPS
jgi:sugar lactone lactonase YvrE